MRARHAHTQGCLPNRMEHWEKDTHQCCPVWALIWITDDPYSGSVPLCAFVETNRECVLCALLDENHISGRLDTHTHHVFTFLPYFHTGIQCHPPPLLTFYYFRYQNNMSIPLNRLIASHTSPHRHTQRKPITTLLYIHILPWLCLWLNSLSPRTADAIVSPLGCYEREWDLRFPFWLKRLAVALHLWAPTHSGMKLQG